MNATIGGVSKSETAYISGTAIPDGCISTELTNLYPGGRGYTPGLLKGIAAAESSYMQFIATKPPPKKYSSQFKVWEVASVRGAAGDDVSHLIKDLDGDGNLELVVGKDLTEYMGGDECVAVWPVIYAWTGAGYANVSHRFPRFYRDELDQPNNEIATLPPSPDSRPGPYDPGECLKAEAAKIQRLLGISPNAGLSQAEALAASADPDTRDFGFELLQDIGTSEALSYIKSRAGDLQKRNPGANPGAEAILAMVRQPGYQNVPPQPEQYKSVPFTTTSTRPATATK